MFFSLAEHVAEVSVQPRLDALMGRSKPPMIYHYTNITRPFTTFTIQLKVDEPLTTRIVVLGRHEKLPTLTSCDVIKVMSNVDRYDGE